MTFYDIHIRLLGFKSVYILRKRKVNSHYKNATKLAKNPYTFTKYHYNARVKNATLLYIDGVNTLHGEGSSSTNKYIFFLTVHVKSKDPFDEWLHLHVQRCGGHFQVLSFPVKMVWSFHLH